MTNSSGLGEAMSPSHAGPLAALIGRHKTGRTYIELAEATKGVISATEWERLECVPLHAQHPLTPEIIDAIALVLNLKPNTVRHYVLASYGLPIHTTRRPTVRSGQRERDFIKHNGSAP